MVSWVGGRWFPLGVPSKDTQLCHFVGRAERLQVKLYNKCILFIPYLFLHHPCFDIVIDIVLWIYDKDFLFDIATSVILMYNVFVCLCVCA